MYYILTKGTSGVPEAYIPAILEDFPSA